MQAGSPVVMQRKQVPNDGSCVDGGRNYSQSLGRDGAAWWAAVYGVAQSWTRLKRLSSSSSSRMLFEKT